MRTPQNRPIPGHPGYTIDQEGRVRRTVVAHGRNYTPLVPEHDGRVTLSGPPPTRGATVVLVSTLMAQVWGEPGPERCPDEGMEHDGPACMPPEPEDDTWDPGVT